MKNWLPLALLVISFNSFAIENKNLERLNFFPNAKAFGVFSIHNETAEVDTPEQAVQTKKINNFTNTLALDYGYKIHKKVFLGICATYENASENSLRYGVALKDRFNSQGMKEPEVFLYSRLREQSQEKGLIDLYASVSKAWGAREIGNDEQHQRYNGRDILKLGLSHGKKEDEWEFKTTLIFTDNGKGEEINHIDNQTYILESYQIYEFQFGVQYDISDRWFGYGTIGFMYRGDEGIRGKKGPDKREIQSGSGSVFTGGVKYLLSNWTMLQGEVYYMRSEYFIKGTSNLDGTYTIGRGTVSIVQAF